MFRFIFKALIYTAGILFIGSFIIQTFPETKQVWETAKEEVSFLYYLSVDEFGVAGTIIIILALGFLFSGKKG